MMGLGWKQRLPQSFPCHKLLIYITIVMCECTEHIIYYFKTCLHLGIQLSDYSAVAINIYYYYYYYKATAFQKPSRGGIGWFWWRWFENLCQANSMAKWIHSSDFIKAFFVPNFKLSWMWNVQWTSSKKS